MYKPKVLFVGIVVLLSSCRKDRECICTRNNETQTKDTYTLSVSKKKDAEKDCDSYFQTYKDYYSSCSLE